MNIKYLIIDTECLSDYWSFQFKNESGIVGKIISCTCDNDFKQFYELLKAFTRPMYHYSIDYDDVMINVLCKLVENQFTNINYHMRKINDLKIQGNINYFRLNAEFWGEYFSGGKDFDGTVEKIKFIHNDKYIDEFLNDYSKVLGRSKVFKELNFNSIPKINYYYTIKQDKSLIPSISLKNLQLINEGFKVKFDLKNYSSMKAIKDHGLWDDFINYSLNDITSLENIFLDKPYSDIQKRMYAVKAVQMIKPDFKVSDNAIYAENNTALIVEILKIENPNKEFTFNYKDYINTPYKKFNDFVDFVNDNKEIYKKDRDLKEAYCQTFEKEYIQDDKNIENDVLIGSFDELVINETTVVTGLGGIHGAIENTIAENLLHLDYEAQYPSIILQYKELFKEIINIELYEAIYNLRFEYKRKLKTLQYDSEEYIECNNIQDGLKLILNSSYGLINSNFNLPISSKTHGRFICLKGQSLLLNLISKLPAATPLINVNTDGIIVPKFEHKEVVEADRDGYFVLGVKECKKIIQYNVNNYILDHKTKGMFKPSIKQQINKNERITVNTVNAVKLLTGKEIKIEPIYFNAKYIGDDKAYYFSSRGTQLIKNLTKPEILCLNGEPILFTSNKEDAELEMYIKYAEITKDNILNFKFVNDKSKNLMYFEYILHPDTDENNKLKRSMKRKLGKLFNKDLIALTGFRGNVKADNYFNRPIKPLIQYNMTQILTSTETIGFSVHPNGDYTIFDIDIMKNGKVKSGWQVIKPLIEKLKSLDTFQCWNSETKNYNRKFIVKKCDYKLPEEYKKYMEILEDKAVVYSLNNPTRVYDCNWTEIKEFK